MDHMTLAGAACLVAGLTDVLDGAIARTWPATQASTLGTYLDPLADKIVINTVATALAVVQALPLPLVALWWAKDVTLVVGTYRHVDKFTQRQSQNETTTNTITTTERAWWHVLDPLHIPLTISPTVTSKVNTGGQFVTLAVALYCPTATWLLTPLVYGTTVTTILSVASYYNYDAFSPTSKKK
jgi:cardiolipin synthase